MAQQVSRAMYYELDGQLWEIKRQLRQQSGYSFDPEQLRKALQAVIEGRFDSAEPAGSFVRDMTKEGWKLLEHVPRRIQSA